MNTKEKEDYACQLVKTKVEAYLAELRQESVLWTDCIQEEENEDDITLENLPNAPENFNDNKAEVQDPLEEIQLGPGRPVFISKLISEEFKKALIDLLTEFQDCFAWDYHEMPGLDRALVEHHLPIKEGYVPHKQGPRRMASEIILKIKEEIE